MASSAYFTPDLFAFLRDLAANNERDWFHAHKARYEASVRDPFLRFIADLAPRLDAISPHLVVDPRPVGGSLFRIHRDIRFSKDKSPYKTHVAAHFPVAAAKGVGSVPGYYLSLGPSHQMAGAGVWRPEPAQLGKIRDVITYSPERWAAVLDAGLKVEGERLSRPPKGYDPGHRFAQDLKLKDFVVSTPVTEREACAPGFLDRYIAVCERAAPLCAFLADAADLPW